MSDSTSGRGQGQQRLLPGLLLLICMWHAQLAVAHNSSSTPSWVMVQQLAAYSVCGGMSKCSSLGQEACVDEAYPEVNCTAGHSCQRQDKWYWRCLPDSLLTSNATGAELDASVLVYGSRVEPPPPDNATPAVNLVKNPNTPQPTNLTWSKPAANKKGKVKGKGRSKPTEDSAGGDAATEAADTSALGTPCVQAAQLSLPITATNNYYLLTYSADPNLRPLVLETLDGAVNLKYKVIRMWVFADGPGWNHLQIAPGVYDKRVLKSLDWLMSQAANRKLKFIMTLTNYWSAYGGIMQYVRWANGLPDNANVPSSEFWFNSKAQAYFKEYARFIVSRYRYHVAVHSWDLINQPRADGDKTGAIAKWITSTAAFVRNYDSIHPLTVGADGFFGPSTPDFLGKNPYTQDSGNDFIAECKSLDYCSFHLYPDHWLPKGTSVDDRIGWSEKWIMDHVAASSKYLSGKPVVLSEYNIEPRDRSQEKMSSMVSRVFQMAIKLKQQLGGVMIWWLSSPNFQFNDSYALLTDGRTEVAGIQKAMNEAVLQATA